MSKTSWQSTKETHPHFKCSKCKSNDIEYLMEEDSECHEDIHYHCKNCNRHWYGEGSDY